MQHPSPPRVVELVPSTIGTYWIYSGADREQEALGVVTKPIRRKLTIVDSIKSGGVSAALVEEKDLLTQEEPICPQEKYLVQLVVDNKRFYQGLVATTIGSWRSLKDEIAAGGKPKELDGGCDGLARLIKVPSPAGTLWDDGGQELKRDSTDRLGTWYCWCVEKTTPLKAGTNIAHFSLPKQSTEYTIAYRSCPADDIHTFVAGIGFTGFHFTHHGTVTDIDEDLVEFHPADAEQMTCENPSASKTDKALAN